MKNNYKETKALLTLIEKNIVTFYKSMNNKIPAEEANKKYNCKYAYTMHKHILYLIKKIKGELKNKNFDIEKVNQDIGFVKGILWAEGFHSFEDLGIPNKGDFKNG